MAPPIQNRKVPMLEQTRGVQVSEPQEPDLLAADDLLRLFAAFLRRQYPIIISVMLLMVVLGTIYLVTTPPRYTAESTVIIDTRKVQLLQQQTVLGDFGVDSATVESQVEILRSESIARSVIKKLNLVDDPVFMNASGGLVSQAVDYVRSFISPPQKTDQSLEGRALLRFNAWLSVNRVGLTYVIGINFTSPSPVLSARIANAIAESYIDEQLEAKYQATRRASGWLQDRISELAEQATKAERAVVDFKNKNNIVNTGGRLINEQQLAEANSALSGARQQTAEAKARLERIDDIMRADVPDATVTDTLRNEVITRLRQQYLDLAGREANWSQKYGASHLAVVNLRNQMLEIKRSIKDELKRISETYRSDYEIAKVREEQAQQRLTQVISQSQQTNEAQVELRDLESKSQAYRALHDNFLQRYTEAVQQQSFPVTDARIITKASPPTNKSHPKTTLVIVAMIVGGAVFGIVVGTLRDFTDRSLRTKAQVEDYLQMDCISVIPTAKEAAWIAPEGKRGFRSRLKAQAAGINSRSLLHDSALWHAVDAPFADFAESVRSIKAAVDLGSFSRPSRVIGITSAVSGEGRSTVAGALAAVIAQTSSRVLLVDGDLRNPMLTSRLAPEAEVGLTQVVSGEADIDDAIWTDPQNSNFAFLPNPAAAAGRVSYPGAILGAEATNTLFADLRDRFDYVVVDLSMLLSGADARATRFIDSYVMVTQWGRTKRETVQHALSGAKIVSDRLLGVVLNKADYRVMRRFDDYGVPAGYPAQRDRFRNHWEADANV